MFRAPAMLLPHESTVAHEQRFIMDAPMISRTRSRTTVDPTNPADGGNASSTNDDNLENSMQVNHLYFLIVIVI